MPNHIISQDKAQPIHQSQMVRRHILFKNDANSMKEDEMTDLHGMPAARGAGKGGTAADDDIRCRGQRPSLSEQLNWFRPPKFTRLSFAGILQLHAFFEADESNADIARRMGLTEAAVWARRKSWLNSRRKTEGEEDGTEGATVNEADGRNSTR